MVVVTVGISIALYYIVTVLREVRSLVQTLRQTSEELEHDFKHLRARIPEGKKVLESLAQLALNAVVLRFFTFRRRPPSQKRRTDTPPPPQ